MGLKCSAHGRRAHVRSTSSVPGCDWRNLAHHGGVNGRERQERGRGVQQQIRYNRESRRIIPRGPSMHEARLPSTTRTFFRHVFSVPTHPLYAQSGARENRNFVAGTDCGRCPAYRLTRSLAPLKTSRSQASRNDGATVARRPGPPRLVAPRPGLTSPDRA